MPKFFTPEFQTTFVRVLDEKVTIQENGRDKKVSRREAFLRALVERAGRDASAAKIVAGFLQTHWRKTPSKRPARIDYEAINRQFEAARNRMFEEAARNRMFEDV